MGAEVGYRNRMCRFCEFDHERVGLEVVVVCVLHISGGVVGVQMVARVAGYDVLGVRESEGPELLCNGIDGVEEEAHV